MHRLAVILLILAGQMAIAESSRAASAGDEFYRGKVIRIIVGFSAGGGFDTFARTVARYMGKYIPGNPSIFVDNMPGAGSLIAANHIYRVAKPDELTIGAFNGNQILGQLVGAQGANFDPRKMEWVGAPGYNHDLCVLHQRTGITNAEQWLAAKTPLRLAGSAPGATTDDVAKVLKEAIGLPMRLVTGYKGTADMRVAVESGQAVIMLQSAPKAHADLPKVPLSIGFAKTPEARQLIEAGVHQPGAITYSYSLAPNTSKERVQLLRRGFIQAVKDPDLLNDANRANLEIAPASGEEIPLAIDNMFKTPPAVVAKLKEVLK